MLLFFAKERPEALALLENTNSILADLLFILQDSMSLYILDTRPEINIATLILLIYYKSFWVFIMSYFSN